jgi:hypothetical protein
VGPSISRLVLLWGLYLLLGLLSFWQAIQLSHANTIRLFVALSPSNLSRWRIFQGCISFKSIATGIPKRYVLADLARTGGMASAAAWLSNASSSNFFFGFGTYYKKQKLRPFFCQKKRAAPLFITEKNRFLILIFKPDFREIGGSFLPCFFAAIDSSGGGLAKSGLKIFVTQKLTAWQLF